MKVLLTTDYYASTCGGVEAVVRELVSRLSCDVAVSTLADITSEGLEFQSVKCMDLTSLLRKQARFAFSYPQRLLNFAKRVKPDVIHAHSPFFFTSMAAVSVARTLNVPIVLTIHLGNVDSEGWMARLYERLVCRRLIRNATIVTAVSQDAANHAKVLTGRKCRVIPNGVDLVRFHPASTPPPMPFHVVFVGRMMPNKGPQYLLEAMAQVPNARCMFAGDGPMLGALKRRTAQLGLDQRVTFLGACDFIPELLQSAHILVRPSSTEGMPLVVLEAMATGIPVLATDVGGTRELIAGDHAAGWFVKRDANDIAFFLKSLVNNPLMAQRVGEAGRRFVEKYHSWDSIIRQYEEVYVKAANWSCGGKRMGSAEPLPSSVAPDLGPRDNLAGY